MENIIIIGAGTAGMTAGIYAARAGKTVLILEEKMYGGQIINTPEVENYPGIQKISGYEFASALYNQAVALGVKIEFAQVLDIRNQGKTKVVSTTAGEYEAEAVIIATGVKNRTLGLEGEEKFAGAGISYCATCDGAFFKGRQVAVAGGGNTAVEDALFLSAYCSRVYVIHRRDSFRAEMHRLEVLKKKENVEFILNSNVTALHGNRQLERITVTDKEGNEQDIPVSGLFVAIGKVPANQPFAALVNLDEAGYIEAGEDCQTDSSGVYAAGDCRTKKIRQLTTAAADGAVAALAACEFIDLSE